MMRFLIQIRNAVSNIVSRIRLFNHFHRHYDLRTAINLTRSREKEMRKIMQAIK